MMDEMKKLVQHLLQERNSQVNILKSEEPHEITPKPQNDFQASQYVLKPHL